MDIHKKLLFEDTENEIAGKLRQGDVAIYNAFGKIHGPFSVCITHKFVKPEMEKFIRFLREGRAHFGIKSPVEFAALAHLALVNTNF